MYGLPEAGKYEQSLQSTPEPSSRCEILAKRKRARKLAESPPKSSCPNREENGNGTAEGEEDGVKQLGVTPNKRQCNVAREDRKTDSMDNGDDEATESEDVEMPNKGEHTSMRDDAHQESGYQSGLDSNGEGSSQHHHCYTVASGEAA